MNRMPKQFSSQRIGKIGEREFLSILPDTWNSYKPESDLGADFFVEIWTEGDDPRPTPVRFAAQVKCHEFYGNLSTCGTDYYSGENFRPCLEYERIKISTLNYLCDQNGQLFSLFLNVRNPKGLTNFASLFDADSHQVLDNYLDRVRSGAGGKAPLFFVSNLKAIGDLLTKYETEGVSEFLSIPLVPQNSNLRISNFFTLSKRHQKLQSRRSELTEAEYDIDKIDHPERLIFSLSWKSKLYHSLTSKRFQTIERIRYVPSLPLKNKAEILQGLMVENQSDVSAVVEILLSVAHCKRSSRFSWIAEYLSWDNASLNFLILRCLRVHRIPIEPESLRIYIGCVEESTKWFDTHFFDGKCGNAFLRRYYDEILCYLHDQIEYGNDSRVSLLFQYVVRTKPSGTFGLFGQLTDGNKSNAMLTIAIDAICRVSGGAKPSGINSQSLIRLAESVGISCYSYDPNYDR